MICTFIFAFVITFHKVIRKYINERNLIRAWSYVSLLWQFKTIDTDNTWRILSVELIMLIWKLIMLFHSDRLIHSRHPVYMCEWLCICGYSDFVIELSANLTSTNSGQENLSLRISVVFISMCKWQCSSC